MEYLEGFSDLNEYVKENGTLEDNLVMQVVYQISHTVAYLHQNSIAHRDIKP